MRLLVTGGAGFIGSNFIYHILTAHPEWEITNVDKLTYAGNLDNLKGTRNNERYKFIQADIADRETINNILVQEFDAIINFAAESHVDRSILDASVFIETNIKGTQVLLDGVNAYGIKRLIQVSTDEVYGSADTERFSELSNLSPSSPYAASKAAADLLCLAYYKTYNTPIVITRCTNNYGPYQFPEKLIPLVITNAMENKTIPVYGDGMNMRDWIFVEDHCRALDTVLQKGITGEIYNIAGLNERTNLDLIHAILKLLDKPDGLIQFVTDRPGHDRRYAIDMTKLNTMLNWQPVFSFDDGLASTVKWYIENKEWWEKIKTGEYIQYYQRMYLDR